MKIIDYQLSNGTIVIRPHQPYDAETCYSAVIESIDDLMPWMFWCHLEISFSEIEDWIVSRPQAWEDDKDYDFAIIDSNQGSFIGNCGLGHIDLHNKVAELGYWIRTSQTNRNFATCASRLVLNFAFDVLKLNRIEIIVASSNETSQHVAEKLGAKKEGLLRQRLNIRDKVHDAYLFSIIPDDLT